MLFNFGKSKRSKLNPFLIIDNVFDESFFTNLKYEMNSNIKKNGDITMGGRINQEFTPDAFDKKKFKAWHQLYEFLDSQQLKQHLQQEYISDLEYWNANMDFSDSAIKPMFHWATSWDGYWREPHHDTQGRLWSFIIFFNDKQWDGGDLITHNDSNVVFHARRYFLKKLPIMNVVEAKENRGVFWLSSPNSYHSVSLQ